MIELLCENGWQLLAIHYFQDKSFTTNVSRGSKYSSVVVIHPLVETLRCSERVLLAMSQSQPEQFQQQLKGVL